MPVGRCQRRHSAREATVPGGSPAAGTRRNGTPPDGASLLPHDMAVKVAKVFVPTLGSEKRLFAVGAQSEFFTATERTR